jgi:hypothetical protein
VRRQWGPWWLGFTTGYYRLLPVGFRTGSRATVGELKRFSLSTTSTTSTTEIVPFLTRESFLSTIGVGKNSLHGVLSV